MKRIEPVQGCLVIAAPDRIPEETHVSGCGVPLPDAVVRTEGCIRQYSEQVCLYSPKRVGSEGDGDVL